MEWARAGNQSQFEHWLEFNESKLGFWRWCVGWCVYMECLNPVNCRGHIYTPQSPSTLWSLVRCCLITNPNNPPRVLSSFKCSR